MWILLTDVVMGAGKKLQHGFCKPRSVWSINGAHLQEHHLSSVSKKIWTNPMLDWCIGEFVVSIIIINNGIKVFTCGYWNCNTNQILIFGGYVKVRESLYTLVIIGVHNNILNHTDTWTILPRDEGSCMVYGPEWCWKYKCLSNIHALMVSKKYETLITDSQKGLEKQTTLIQQ